MDKVILHSDLNACYASIELLYDETLRGRPMAVCGSEDRRHGIVLSKTEEAKRAGVKTAMTIWQARQCCPELVIVPPHYERYVAYSREVQKIYARYTDRREPFGIDESWLDLTGCVSVRDGYSAAQEIRQRVKSELGLTVSIGLSWNKVFAKLGSDYKKPDAVTRIDRENYRSLVWPLPVTELLYVGPRTGEKLAALGINTIGELAQAERATLRLRFGVMGERLHDFANGLDNAPVLRENEYPPAKSIGNGTTPPRDICSREDALPVLVSLSECVGARLRRAGMLAGTITVEVKSEVHARPKSRRRKLLTPTDCDRELREIALALLEELNEWPAPVRSLSLRAEELFPCAAPEQLGLFSEYEAREEQRGLDRALDRIRTRFGSDSVCRGAVFRSPEMAVPLAQEEFSFVRKLENIS